jgi:2-polyprenyl-6-methoxyphenol hydroxylase-like FAD-dependent oxidoreductase
MQTQFDAIIVGAGPAGSTAAILLARAGWSVALVEKQNFPRRKVCGECLAASNLPLLEALGIAMAFEAVAGPELRQLSLMYGKRTAIAALPSAADDKHPWGRTITRESLDALLLEQARRVGAHILQPWSVKHIEGASGAWRCDARAHDGTETTGLDAPVLIDAHGSWEALPTGSAPGRTAHKGNDLLAFKANFRGTKLKHGLLPVLFFDGGYGGMVVGGAGLTTVAGCVRRDRFETLRHTRPGLSAGDTFDAMLRRECAGVGEALRSATREGPWLASGPLAPGIRLRGEDTLFRIGNAAGEAHPILGEGMSMALQSAWLLCEQLLKPASRHHLTDTAWQGQVAQAYAAQWRHQFQARMRLASAFAHAAMRPALAAPLVQLARAWPGLLTLGAIQGGKTRYLTQPATENTPSAHPCET